jgi:stress-induced morphogen
MKAAGSHRLPVSYIPVQRKWEYTHMPMAADDIAKLIRDGIPDAEVEIVDLAGDGDHYKAIITAESFRGMPRVKQHQAVYAALGGRMGGELHALALETRTPAG